MPKDQNSLTQTFTIYNTPKYHMGKVKCNECGKIVFLKDLDRREFSKYYRHNNCDSTKFTPIFPDWLKKFLKDGVIPKSKQGDGK